MMGFGSEFARLAMTSGLRKLAHTYVNNAQKLRNSHVALTHISRITHVYLRYPSYANIMVNGSSVILAVLIAIERENKLHS